ncbi:MAG TPA: glycosyltransferase [Thermoanaerobaculia bacterium]|nr:glycosyltransferase [Thermoanaerobaculia bacterium]
MSRTSAITAVLVSWKDADETLQAVTSLAQARALVPPDGPRVSLVVVDNDGGALDRSALLARWPDATLLVNDENRGFGPAVNQAAEIAREGVLLLVNPDTRAIGEPFSEIARAFDENPRAVAVAPRLMDDAETTGRLAPPGMEDQFSFQLRRLPRLSDDARELLLFDHLTPDNRWRRIARYADRDPDAPLDVEQAAAAALAVRGDVFRAVGGFDERFVPAWFEDVDLCARLLERGSILYWPAAKFRHTGGAASRELGYARFLPAYYRNAIRYRRRRYGAAARLGYRALLAAGMVLRLAALPLRRSPRARRESALAYLRALAVAFYRLR